MRAEFQKAQEQYAELERAKSDEAAAHGLEVERLRVENVELARLRGEVQRLRDEAQQLRKETQAQAAQASLASAQAQQQDLLLAERQRVLALVQQAQGESAQRDACIEKLRRIDEAKQQWGQKQLASRLAPQILTLNPPNQRQLALEHGKVGALIPTSQDIEVYFSGTVLPRCPAGGTYTLNAVNAAPTCSIPGHALPR